MKVLQKIKLATLGLVTVMGLGLGCAVRPVVAFSVSDCPGYTDDNKDAYNSEATNLAECLVKNENGSLMSNLQTILNVIFGVIGFVAVVMLVYGGIQYTVSSGDAAKVKKAKDTILYGIVGLIIALLAAAIVNFVLVGVFTKAS